MKHTPGPWQFEDQEPNEEIEIFVPAQPCGRYVIATVCYGYDEPFESQQRANAKLIAAAPELLAAAQKVLDGLHARIDMAKVETPVFVGIADLASAIAKATE